jgi:FKBP-type peptidyl-prolyl cis-trans isomerase SlyD
MKVSANSVVNVDYLIRLGEGEFYPRDGKPEEIAFCLGTGVMPPGLEEALMGMEAGDHKVVLLQPTQAYGEVDQEMIMEVDRADFEQGMDLQPGMVFETVDEQNQPVLFIVSELKGDRVVIDFNHPLAGKELEFDITIKGIREATPEDLAPHHSCSCSGCGSDQGNCH